jgi:hypothetical protein
VGLVVLPSTCTRMALKPLFRRVVTGKEGGDEKSAETIRFRLVL